MLKIILLVSFLCGLGCPKPPHTQQPRTHCAPSKPAGCHAECERPSWAKQGQLRGEDGLLQIQPVYCAATIGFALAFMLLALGHTDAQHCTSLSEGLQHLIYSVLLLLLLLKAVQDYSSQRCAATAGQH
jgi:hypothetical protein